MASQPALKRGRFTWTDYRSWDDRKRWEIVGGEAYEMSPAPTIRHQDILMNMGVELRGWFTRRRCKVVVAPVDVRLSEEDVVQPDIVVVCDPERVTPTHIEGAPTLVVEVLSPSTELHDRTRKMPLYAKAGVKEVWLVTPYPWLVEVFQLAGSRYVLHGAYSKDDRLRSPSFPRLAIGLAKVFDFPLEPGERVQMVRESRPPYGTRKLGRRPGARRPL
jgi:Uma2 family endonuclease